MTTGDQPDSAETIRQLAFDLQLAKVANAELTREIELLKRSTSWRVTAPLRWLSRFGDRLRKARRRGWSLPVRTIREDAGHVPEARFTELALLRLRAAAGQVAPDENPGAVRGGRPRLAYFSPLPPQRSGISDYSAELIPELARHYDIDVIAAHVADVSANDLPCVVRDVAWFMRHSADYDRVLYQVGNSHFHSYMFPLIARYPGVVVLHDFYLGNIMYQLELHEGWTNAWTDALLYSHGYRAVAERHAPDGVTAAAFKYPVNRALLENAQGVIVHSEHARTLGRSFYDAAFPDRWAIIPSLRKLPMPRDRAGIRAALGIGADDFVVCSFGMVGQTKLNARLLDAWLGSSLAARPDCRLVFVGEVPAHAYTEALRRAIAQSPHADRITLTDFAPRELYEQYLVAADLAVQLHTLSRGETSAAVRDCMGYALPVIVNAHGAAAELPRDAVVTVADDFVDAELTAAIERLRADRSERTRLSRAAQEYVAAHLSPAAVAAAYCDAIEGFAAAPSPLFDPSTLRRRARQLPPGNDPQAWRAAARALAVEAPIPRASRQFLVDVTNVAASDLGTGIERVVRGQLMELLNNPPAGYRVEPVRLSRERGHWEYVHARAYAARLLGLPTDAVSDAPADVLDGDILLVSDFAATAVIDAAREGLYSDWRARGASVNFVVYDLLPLSLPQCFPPTTATTHAAWLAAVAGNADRLIGISATVADEVRRWLRQRQPEALTHLAVTHIHLGADIAASAPSHGVPADVNAMLARLRVRPTFLMVGTLEPRKGHLQALAAFHALWRRGVDVNLVIAGSEGWKAVPEAERRTIPAIMEAIRTSPELGRRLVWIEDASDELVGRLYDGATCLLAASDDEGFGLPLVEAARHGTPVLARDIPVFREVGGEHLAYFAASSGDELAASIEQWLAAHAADRHVRSDGLRWLSWADSVAWLTSILREQVTTPAAQRSASAP